MDEGYYFAAPWGKLLKGMTAVSTIILVGVAALGLFFGPRHNVFYLLIMLVVPLGIWIGGCFFMICGFVLTADSLVVLRPGWQTRLSLQQFIGAEVDPTAMKGSIRLFGNGGLFCFSGLFKNRKLGKYRAFATDFKHSVVLRFSQRTVVVTPGNPAAFAARIKDVTGK